MHPTSPHVIQSLDNTQILKFYSEGRNYYWHISLTGWRDYDKSNDPHRKIFYYHASKSIYMYFSSFSLYFVVIYDKTFQTFHASFYDSIKSINGWWLQVYQMLQANSYQMCWLYDCPNVLNNWMCISEIQLRTNDQRQSAEIL